MKKRQSISHPSTKVTPGPRICEAIKADGQRCKAPAMSKGHYCFFHSQATAEQRKDAQRRGGEKGKRQTLPKEDAEYDLATISGVVQMLGSIINKTLRGDVDYKISNSVSVLSGNLLRALEGNELEQRLNALEERLEELSYGRPADSETHSRLGAQGRASARSPSGLSIAADGGTTPDPAENHEPDGRCDTSPGNSSSEDD